MRVALALAIFSGLSITIALSATGTTAVGRWLASAQLVPAILAGAGIWLVAWIVITISFGRVYCSTVCPMGTIMDAAAHCGRLAGKGSKARYRYASPLNGVRLIAGAAVAAALCFGMVAVVEYTDPYFLYRHIVLAIAKPAAIGFGSVAVAAVVLLGVSLTSWAKGRIICNTVCPAGSLLGLLSRQPIYRIDINTDLCIHCGKCEDACKAACINLKDCTVDTSRCVMCLNCTSACPNGAITLRRGRYNLSTPLMQKT